MVSSEKRAAAANALQRLLDGALSGDTFLDEFPKDRNDPALGAIYERLWFCFDDRRKPLPIRDRPDYDQVRRLLERCRNFLRTDLEYRWPSKFKASITLILLRLIGASAAARKLEERESEILTRFGNIEEWPFDRGQNGTA